MLYDKRACIKAIFAILLLYSIFTVSATAQSTGTVDVTRIINGSHIPGYQAGDKFVVELDYTTTGMVYAAAVSEKLPNGWTIVDSSHNYTYDAATNTYLWNITSPISGVTSGKIYYLAQVASDAADDGYQISGGVAVFDSFDAIKDLAPMTTSSTAGDTDVNVVDVAHNGPCIWITDIKEYDSYKDGDGHLESGERMFLRYKIYDNDGLDLSNVVVNVNGQPWTTPAGAVVSDGASYKEAYTANTITAPNNLVNIDITATDNQSITQQFSMDTYIPAYDYSAWFETSWNGMDFWTASAGHTSDRQKGNWILLSGGNSIRMPDVNYSGPATINYGPNSILSQFPLVGSIFGGVSIDAINATSAATVNIPSLSGPSNAQYKSYMTYTQGHNDSVTATFNGEDAMAGRKFHVMLLDLTKVTDKIVFTDSATIKSSMKSLSLQDIKDSVIDQTDIVATGSSFTVDSSAFSELSHMSQGYYALLVWDYGVPEIPALVSSMPIIVTKSDMTVDLTDVSPKLGEPLMFNDNIPDAGPGTFTYITALIPEANYKADVNYASTGTLDGSTVDMNVFGIAEKVTLHDDGSIYLKGLVADRSLSKDDLVDTTLMKNILMDELNAADIAVNVQTTSETSDFLISVNTKDTMPKGKYIVLTAVIDRDTGKMVAINQTTVNLGGSWTFKLTKGWNLISIPIVPQDNNLTAFFGPSVMSDIAIVWEYNSSNVSSPWAYYTTETTKYKQGKLTAVNERQGYWVECYNPITFTVTGDLPVDSSVSLKKGWNLVGNPTMDIRQPWSVYSLDRITWGYNSSNVASPWAYYTTETTKYKQGKLVELDPGYGYWVEV